MKLSSVTVFLSKVEQEKKAALAEKDRLVHRVQQLELEIRNNLEVGNDLINRNSEYSNLILVVQKMAQFEDLMSQIETDKNDLFDKISNLEEENEQHLKDKHSLKVELIQIRTALADNENQLKKAREHIDLLDSLNTIREEELKEFGDLSKDSENAKVQFGRLQKTLADLRLEFDEVLKQKNHLEKHNIQLAEDLGKEREYSKAIKQELKDAQGRYRDSIGQKKNELGLSNIAASRMFNYYKMRESINNRLSNVNMPVSFAGEENIDETQTKVIGGGKPAGAMRESTANNRMSLRTSVLQGRLW